MSKVNACLRRTFTVFNVFFAVVGALIVAFTFLHQLLTNFHEGENVRAGIYGLYVVGTVTMVVASLGAYGAHKESRVCLSVFLGFMVTGSLLMLIEGIPAAIARPQVEDLIEEDMRSFVPLDQAPGEVKAVIDTVQAQVHCCGLFSHTDWGNNIPVSCRCNPMEDSCQSPTYRELFALDAVPIYSKTCFPVIMDSFRLIVSIVIGIFFTLAALAILGIVLSSIMIHQLRSPSRPTIVFKIPSTFVPPPPKYEKLQEDPPAYC